MNEKIVYSYRKLEVWKLAMNLVNAVYKVSKNFPDEEKFSLTSQLKRASISIPLNIAEGSIKRTKKDFGSYIRISLGSLMELNTCLDIALNLKYIGQSEYGSLGDMSQELYFKLISLDKYLMKEISQAK